MINSFIYLSLLLNKRNVFCILTYVQKKEQNLTNSYRILLHVCFVPVKRWGNLMGRMTASFSASLAPSKPATSLHLMFGFSITMAPAKCYTA